MVTLKNPPFLASNGQLILLIEQSKSCKSEQPSELIESHALIHYTTVVTICGVMN